MTQVALRGKAKSLSNKTLFRMKKAIPSHTTCIWPNHGLISPKLPFQILINKMHLFEFDYAFESETIYISKERDHSEMTKTAIQV